MNVWRLAWKSAGRVCPTVPRSHTGMMQLGRHCNARRSDTLWSFWLANKMRFLI